MKNLKKNRSKDLDFNPRANTYLPVCVTVFTKQIENPTHMRISKFLRVKEYVQALVSLQQFHS